LTEIAGSSDVVERGFVTYSNEAKDELLGVDPALIRDQGAVSADVAKAMALGAIERSRADIAVAITGIAGPAAPRRRNRLASCISPQRDAVAPRSSCARSFLATAALSARERARRLRARRRAARASRANVKLVA